MGRCILLLALLLATHNAIPTEIHPVIKVTKAKKLNLRAGPGRQYRVEWTYIQRHLPLQTLVVINNWVKVRDIDGVVGWVAAELLVDKKYAMTLVPVRALRRGGDLAFTADARVIVRVDKCEGALCKVKVGGTSGWVEAEYLWGALPQAGRRDKL
jgi:SH3-like domain-containing protein